MPVQTSAAVDKEAAAWAAKLDRAPLSDQDEQALAAWAAGDPRRLGAYARAVAVNVRLDRAQGLGDGFAPQQHPVAVDGQKRRLMMGGAALAASAALGLVGYSLNELHGEIATRKGDVRRTPLSDGSAVTLNTATTIRPSLDGKLRRVALLRGEALFDVAKDPARPFVVTAGDVRVRAVGTSFTVRRREDGSVAVLVREGVVEVWRAGETSRLRLTADGATSVAPTGAIAAISLPTGEAERATAWRQGQVNLDGLTLGEAAAEFGRYSDHRILIDDPSVAKLKVTGLFSISDPDGFARAAALGLGLTATAETDGVRLSAHPG
jgi:transmembrane sensor